MTAERKWLIRSKKRGCTQIVGPVSARKVKELKESNVIGPEVEICSENGFWFWIKEEELYKKYIDTGEPQPFNPISEAKSVLTSPAGEEHVEDVVNHDITMVGGIDISALKNDTPVTTSEDSAEDSVTLPDEDDLAFPDVGSVQVAPVQAGVSTADKEAVSEKLESTSEHIDAKIALPSEEDLAFPDVGPSAVTTTMSESEKGEGLEENPVEEDTTLEEQHTEEKVKKTKGKKKKKKKKKQDRRDRHKPKRNDRLLLLFVGGLLVIFLIIAYLFLGNNKLFSIRNSLLPSAYATAAVAEKKN